MRIGNCEIFKDIYLKCDECDEFWHQDCDKPCKHDGVEILDGYFYWCCFVGCLPESDPIGPFKTEEEAVNDARTDGFIEEEELNPDSESDAFISDSGPLGSKTTLSIGQKTNEGTDRAIQWYLGRPTGQWEIIEVIAYGFKDENDATAASQDCLEANLDSLGAVSFYGIYTLLVLA